MMTPTLVAPDTFVFEHDGLALRCEGAARRLVIQGGPGQASRASDAVAEALAGSAGIAVGALPFDERRQATLVVPERVERARSRATAREAHATEPGGIRVTPVPSAAVYAGAVREATQAIARGEITKVVLARMLVVQSDTPFDAASILSSLRAREPGAYVFAAQGFVGATPEMLVSRRGMKVISRPLAGTARRSAEPAADEVAAAGLLASAKDRDEHRIVVEAVTAALGEVCIDVEVDGPLPVATGGMWHLGTTVTGTLREPLTSLQLAGLLHPTPAVCGTPVDRARAFISAHEGFDRTLYAGLVGWQDATGDGEWAIALRCAEVRERMATLFAGAGIVGASDPESEVAETDAKFAVMLGALGAS